MNAHPMVMLLAGMAAGVLVGMLLPVTRLETERLRPMMRRGGEAIKTIATATARSMKPEDASAMT